MKGQVRKLLYKVRLALVKSVIRFESEASQRNEILRNFTAKFLMLFGGGGGGGKRTPHHTNMTDHFQIWQSYQLWGFFLVVLTDFILTGPFSKVEKTVEGAIHACSTADANFDKYKKHSLLGATGLEKVDGGSCIRLFSP